MISIPYSVFRGNPLRGSKLARAGEQLPKSGWRRSSAWGSAQTMRVQNFPSRRPLRRERRLVKPTLRARAFLAFVIGALCSSIAPSQGKPRPPLPPIPERGVLTSLRFNNGLEGDALLSVNLNTVESWSGYALRMSGAEPSRLALREVTSAGKTNFSRAAGSVRFWFSPEWTSAREGGTGPGVEVELLEFGACWETAAQASFSLRITDDGSSIALFGPTAVGSTALLEAPIAWCGGE